MLSMLLFLTLFFFARSSRRIITDTQSLKLNGCPKGEYYSERVFVEDFFTSDKGAIYFENLHSASNNFNVNTDGNFLETYSDLNSPISGNTNVGIVQLFWKLYMATTTGFLVYDFDRDNFGSYVKGNFINTLGTVNFIYTRTYPTYLAVGSSLGLELYDTSDQANPSHSHTISGTFESVEIFSLMDKPNVAFLSQGTSGLQMVDLTNGYAVLGTLTTTTSIHASVASIYNLYIADDEGLKIYYHNYGSLYANLVFRSALNLPSGSEPATLIEIGDGGDKVYLVSNSTFYIIDASDDTNPSILTSYQATAEIISMEYSSSHVFLNVKGVGIQFLYVEYDNGIIGPYYTLSHSNDIRGFVFGEDEGMNKCFLELDVTGFRSFNAQNSDSLIKYLNIFGECTGNVGDTITIDVEVYDETYDRINPQFSLDVLPQVCTGNCVHGSFNLDCNCICNTTEGYFGPECDQFACFSVLPNEPNVCNFNGNCVSPNKCNCTAEGYSGDNCEIWDCFGVGRDQCGVTCSGKGSCTKPGYCSCYTGYEGEECQNWSCFSIANSDSLVCNGRGNCSSIDECSCQDGYEGAECEAFQCFGVSFDNISVCSSHGVCSEFDSCVCKSGWGGDNCDQFACFGVLPDELNVCNSRGKCVASNECICSENHYSDFCQERIESPITVGSQFIHFEYEVQESFLISKFGEDYTPIDCELVIKNYETLGNGSICSWIMGNDTYSSESVSNILNITLGDAYSVQTGNLLEVILVSSLNPNETYSFELNKQPAASSSVGEVIGGIAFAFFLILAVLCCIIIAITAISIFFYIKNEKQKKKTKGIDDEELKIIVDEHLASKKDETGQISETETKFKIDQSLFKIKYEEIKLSKVIGQGGGDATVYKAVWANQDVVFKVFKIHKYQDDKLDVEAFKKELEFQSSISHPNIIQFFGATLQNARLGIVMEWCSNGDFFRFVKVSKKLGLNEKLRLLKESAIGMAFLHSKDLIHRDLKSANIFISANKTAKIADFGLGRRITGKEEYQELTQRVGTCFYMAPEIVLGKLYGKPVDVFSYAIVIWEIVAESDRIYGENSTAGVERKVAKDPNYRPILDDNIKRNFKGNKWLKDVMVKCWAEEPSERPTFEEIVKEFDKSWMYVPPKPKKTRRLIKKITKRRIIKKRKKK